MTRTPQRTVEAALMEGDEGKWPVTALDLLTMPENSWGVIRDRITDRRNGKDGLLAYCMACGNRVFVRTSKLGGEGRPLFQHYKGSDPSCPWYQGENANPNKVRAEQYNGLQESEFHRHMCDLIGELAALDERYIKHRINQYLPPDINSNGRFPDVYVMWESFGPFVVEFQLSSTFQTEISARCKHYEYEGVPLLWVLFGVDVYRKLPQNIDDIIRRHRGNAFVIDHASVQASREQRTLVLSCFLKNEAGFDPPKLVRFDELTIPRTKLPFYEDRIVKPLLKEFTERRRPWFEALKEWDHYSPIFNFDNIQSRLIAAAFSIVANANGKDKNYASRHPNIVNMLHTFLSAGNFSPYCDLLQEIMRKIARSTSLLDKTRDHFKRYRSHQQVAEGSLEWETLKNLLPEVLDPRIRDELQYLDALPDWANPNIQD